MDLNLDFYEENEPSSGLTQVKNGEWAHYEEIDLMIESLISHYGPKWLDKYVWDGAIVYGGDRDSIELSYSELEAILTDFLREVKKCINPSLTK